MESGCECGEYKGLPCNELEINCAEAEWLCMADHEELVEKIMKMEKAGRELLNHAKKAETTISRFNDCFSRIAKHLGVKSELELIALAEDNEQMTAELLVEWVEQRSWESDI